MPRILYVLRRLTISLLSITVMLVIAVAIMRKHSRGVRVSAQVITAAITEPRVHGSLGVLGIGDRLFFNYNLAMIAMESGVDMQMVFAKLRGRRSLDEFAADEMTRRRLGKHDNQRALLIVYDESSGRMRVEVSYALEGYFPDAFVGRLVEDHASAFFKADQPQYGLRLLSWMLHERIRDAVLGGTFDPTPFEQRVRGRFVSGGAGATATAPHMRDTASVKLRMAELEARDLMRGEVFVPQPTPDAVYQKWIEWLGNGGSSPNVTLFTPQSRSYLGDKMLSGPYFDWILASIWQRKYEIVERGEYAMLFYTDTPLRSPLFFRKSAAGWQYDLLQEVYSTAEFGGGPYTWSMVNAGYPQEVFGDLFEWFEGYKRVKGGDNRPLPTTNRNPFWSRI